MEATARAVVRLTEKHTEVIDGAVWAAARVTPTREQIADTLAQVYEPADEVLEIDLQAADAVLALMQELAVGSEP